MPTTYTPVNTPCVSSRDAVPRLSKSLSTIGFCPALKLEGPPRGCQGIRSAGWLADVFMPPGAPLMPVLSQAVGITDPLAVTPAPAHNGQRCRSCPGPADQHHHRALDRCWRKAQTERDRRGEHHPPGPHR